ncbi:MAG: hypothetical protein RBT63_02785 [Bdellovibrionales bacterium]|jgi:hypothetical protein|nr:hypothetical protein [Bdellovibrionales bacterium]
METVKQTRVRIFSRGWEGLVLAVGFFPLAVIIWNPTWITKNWEFRFWSDLIFLNVVHNAFSFYIIWKSNEIRRAIRERYDGQPWRLHLKAASVFTLSSLILVLLYQNEVSNPLFYFIILTLLSFLPLQHAMSQQIGLSRLYDHALKQQIALTEKQSARLSLMAKIERIGHRIALLGVLLQASAWLEASPQKLPTWWLPASNWAGDWGHRIFLVGTTLLLASYILRPYWWKSNQWVFNLRRAWEIFPAYFSLNYIALQRLNHGLEYLAVTATIDKASQRRKSRAFEWTVFLLLSSTVAYLYLHVIAARWNPSPFSGLNLGSLSLLFASVSAAISITHYYYDSQIFRFSQPEFRDNVLPLLSPAKPTERRISGS